MAEQLDDIDAVRAIIKALESFEKNDRERILRWVREKLGLDTEVSDTRRERTSENNSDNSLKRDVNSLNRDIKSFVTGKNPTSDTHFAATVAYYYAFEAPPAEKQDSITASDLQEACRKTGRERLGDPGKTLRNAVQGGLLDRVGTGSFKLNTVGENLVAVTLPSPQKVTPTATRKPKKRKPPRR